MAMEKWGEYAFIVGVIIALLAGIAAAAGVSMDATVIWAIAIVLLVIGVIVGFLNIKDKETMAFLIAAIALLATSAVGWEAIPYIGAYIKSILAYVAALVAPAAVIVALKSVWSLAKAA